MFAERGYSGATMPAIAERAGVSVKTVEAAFGTKAKLLKELIDVCIAGDDEPVALADRPVVAEMEAETDPARMIEMFAVFATAISKRLAVVSRVLADAAASSSELAALRRTTLDTRYSGALGIRQLPSRQNIAPNGYGNGRRHRMAAERLVSVRTVDVRARLHR